MASCHHWPVEDDDPLDEQEALAFWRFPKAFSAKRHTEKIEAFKTVAQTWRMKERVSGLFLRTLHVNGLSSCNIISIISV